MMNSKTVASGEFAGHNTASVPSVAHAYRPEVDGLRAVAVLPVILFHAGFSAFSGGYVGVDVFFVISGYLITSIIVTERLEGRFSLAEFYERRARRILPALFLVMAVCVALSWLLMAPPELENFGISAAAVPAFVSNILFWRTSGYFGGAAELKPLLHTWSLGIEEQYYVVLPLILAAALKFGLQRAIAIVAALAAVSLALSIWLTGLLPMANFFLLPPRAWELLAGSLLAMAIVAGMELSRLAKPLREWAGALGLALIVLPIFLYNEATPFPGLAAAPPVVGTMLILAMTSRETIVGRLLTMPPMMWVGLISYSAYLWHQPVFAFARMLWPTHLPGGAYLGLSAVALAAAWLSWRFVEAPFRNRRRFARRTIFAASAIGSLAFIAIGLGLAYSKGAPERFSPSELAFVSPEGSPITGCPDSGDGTFTCPLGDRGEQPTIVLLGDSHAYALAPALDAELARRGLAGVLLHTACHPVPGIFDNREQLDPASREKCSTAHREIEARATAPDIDTVLVAIRWTLRLYPMGQEIDQPWFDNHEGGVEDDTPFRRNLTFGPDGVGDAGAEAKTAAVRGYLERLAGHTRTIVMMPVPEAGLTASRLNMAALARGEAPPPSITTSYARFLERNRAAIAALDGAKAPGLSYIDPTDILCDKRPQGRCVVQANGVLYYYDDDHLSASGAQPIIRKALVDARPGGANRSGE